MADLRCRIVVAGELNAAIPLGLTALTSAVRRDQTVLEGTVADQSALAAILDQLFGLGLAVMSLDTMPDDQAT